MTTKPAAQIGSAGQPPRLTWLPDPPVSPDMQEQFPYISRAYVILEDHFRPRPDVFVGGEGYLSHCEALAPWQSRCRGSNVCAEELHCPNGIATLRSQ